MPFFYDSFAQECIFLVGGETKATEPVPIFLRSGDICIMSAEARLVYHAVPRIMPSGQERLDECFNQFAKESENETNNSETCDKYRCLNSNMMKLTHCDDWTFLEDYLSQTRINFNIRQVLAPDKDFPVES